MTKWSDMWDNSNYQWGMVDRNWPQIETGIKHMSNTLDVAIQLDQSPRNIKNTQRKLPEMELVCRKPHPDSSQQIKCQETGYNLKRVRGKMWACGRNYWLQAGSVSFLLTGCFHSADPPAKPVSTINQPHNTTSLTDYETLRSFI